MASRRSREAALADLVAGLLDARLDPATDRFDAELAAAEEDGRVDPQTAKVLRWWQREAQRALVEHARVVLPPTLLALEQAASGADREAEASAASWARAAADVGSEDVDTVDVVTQDVVTRGSPEVVDEDVDDVRDGAELEETDGDDPDDDAQESSEHTLTPPADLAEHRRRLLVAGLTRVRTP
jgi:hypothetical protein